LGKWQEPYFQGAFNLQIPKLKVVTANIANDAFARNLWYLRELPKLIDAVAADVVHLSFPVPIHRRTMRCPVVVSLHDLYPYDAPNNFGFPRVFFNRVFLHQCLREVDRVACVSDATLLRLRMRFPRFAHRKALVVRNCVTIESNEPSPPPGEACRFILMVAQHRLNKNIPLALEAFGELRRRGKIDQEISLILVGNDGPETTSVKLLTKRLALEENVRFMEGVGDGELRWLYAHCECLMAPSFTEGFGLPIAEALVCGCRVICSDIPAFREIGGNACHYFDLHAASGAAAMADAVCNALAEPTRRAEDLERFSLASVSTEYAALYAQLQEVSRDMAKD
jgi:glycosyltransferase involved in cell wall biosynthesis